MPPFVRFSPPFLAASVKDDDPGPTATGNPNFVDYALEVYQGDEFVDWHWVPGNGFAQRQVSDFVCGLPPRSPSPWKPRE